MLGRGETSVPLRPGLLSPKSYTRVSWFCRGIYLHFIGSRVRSLRLVTHLLRGSQVWERPSGNDEVLAPTFPLEKGPGGPSVKTTDRGSSFSPLFTPSQGLLTSGSSSSGWSPWSPSVFLVPPYRPRLRLQGPFLIDVPGSRSLLAVGAGR